MLVAEGSTNYLWDGTGLLAEVDGADPAGFPLLDLLGSVRLRTDDTGVAVGTADYEAYGGVRAQSGAQGGLGWTGELRDPDTGLTSLRARDYAPGSGRFLQRDALQPSGPGTQGFNRYAYAAGNPATLTDPSGHSAGAIDWSATAQYGREGFRYAALFAGLASPVLAVGGFTVTGFALVAIILAVILVVVGITLWCQQHGCTMPSFDVLGWIRGIVTACPKLPEPSENCATRAATEFGSDAGSSFGGDPDVTDIASDIASAGVSAYEAYKECKGNDGRNPWKPTHKGTKDVLRCGKFGRFYQSVSDGLWWSKDLAGHGGSAWKVFRQIGQSLVWQFDADEYGDRIEGKHKGPTGLDIPLKNCQRVEYVDP
jgi:RHS repeat-associated protein